MQQHAHILIRGDVTGVGFRSWTKRNALNLELEGWVRNVDLKTVEAIFWGKKESIEKMIDLCKNGPEVSWVQKVEVTWETKEPSVNGFSIV